MVPEAVTLVAHVGGGATLLANLTRHNLALLIWHILTFSPSNIKLCKYNCIKYFLLWYVHTELDLLLLLAHHLVEDIISLSWSLGTLVVSVGECVAKLFGNIGHLTFAGYKGNLLGFIFKFLKNRIDEMRTYICGME